MVKFGGFRATVYFGGPSKEPKDDDVQPVSSGVYRTYKEDSYGYGSVPDPPKKLNPSMVKLPESTNVINKTPKPTLQNAKSVPDLRQPTSSTQPITKDQSKSTTNVTQQPQARPQQSKRISEKLAKNQEKELKKIEKQRLAEEKKREAERKKMEKKQKADAAKETKLKVAAEAKLKKEREKAEKERLKKEGTKNVNKTTTSRAPPPPPMPNSHKSVSRAPGVPELKITNPLARAANPLVQVQPAHTYSTNTLGSTISTSSGPPPYSEQLEANKGDNTGNTSFSKPIEQGNSWDFISQHRQQMSRPVNDKIGAGDRTKRTQLQYSVANAPKIPNEGNSDA